MRRTPGRTRCTGAGCTPTRAARIGLGDPEEVRALGVVEAQRAGNSVEHLIGHIEVAALFEAAVVVHAHTRQLCDLLATQPRHPSRPARATDIDVVDAQARAAGAEEVPQLRVVLHAIQSDGPTGALHARTNVGLPDLGRAVLDEAVSIALSRC